MQIFIVCELPSHGQTWADGTAVRWHWTVKAKSALEARKLVEKNGAKVIDVYPH
jgi:hypothetical protein